MCSSYYLPLKGEKTAQGTVEIIIVCLLTPLRNDGDLFLFFVFFFTSILGWGLYILQDFSPTQVINVDTGHGLGGGKEQPETMAAVKCDQVQSISILRFCPLNTEITQIRGLFFERSEWGGREKCLPWLGNSVCSTFTVSAHERAVKKKSNPINHYPRDTSQKGRLRSAILVTLNTTHGRKCLKFEA